AGGPKCEGRGHRVRPLLAARFPVHVTLEVVAAAPYLRRGVCCRAIRAALVARQRKALCGAVPRADPEHTDGSSQRPRLPHHQFAAAPTGRLAGLDRAALVGALVHGLALAGAGTGDPTGARGRDAGRAGADLAARDRVAVPRVDALRRDRSRALALSY